ncbi:NINE protein [Chloroflexota bacterium]
MATWLFWFFCGWYGVHRFYLGYFRSGFAMTVIWLFILLGFVLSLVFHITNPLFGVFMSIAIIVIVTWYFVDIFKLPGMLRKDEQRVQKEALLEIVIARGGESD